MYNYKEKQPKGGSLKILTLGNNQETHSLDVILKNPFIKNKWCGCQNLQK